MLYPLLRLIIGSGIRLHFRRIETNGLQRLEGNRPTIIIANHTNALTDPLLLGILLRRRIHFYVRGDVFEHPAARALFEHLGMMPIFRLKDGREQLSRNESSNKQALEILKRGGAILIFAEGSSDEHKLLRPVKKGPFRLAADAAQVLPQPPDILPLGINYLEPEAPDTTAWLLAGDKLPWPKDWQQLPEARLSLLLMKEAAQALPPLTLHAGDMKRAAIAEPLLLLQKNNPQARQPFHFSVAQRLLQRLAALPEEDFKALQKKTLAYEQLLNEWQLTEKAFKKSSAPMLWLSAVAGFPVWAAGLLFHYPVFALARYIVRRKVSAKDFISSIHLLTVTFANVIWYLICLIALLIFWNATGAVLLLLALAACGIISETLLLPTNRILMQKLRLWRLRQKRKEPFKRLLSLRRDLLAWLNTEPEENFLY